MVETEFHASVGTLRYSQLEDGASKLIVEVEPDIAYLALALAPRALGLQRQRFTPHISVIRHERICDHPLWARHEGERVPFEYSMWLHDNDFFFWLRARCQRLIDIRVELGLPAHSKATMPPDGTRWFHITVGNIRHLRVSKDDEVRGLAGLPI